ncbi:hypothetical protein ACHAXT_006372 [Thalassiosira profunda]
MRPLARRRRMRAGRRAKNWRRPSLVVAVTASSAFVAGAFQNAPSLVIRTRACIPTRSASYWRASVLHSSKTEESATGVDSNIIEGSDAHHMDHAIDGVDGIVIMPDDDLTAMDGVATEKGNNATADDPEISEDIDSSDITAKDDAPASDAHISADSSAKTRKDGDTKWGAMPLVHRQRAASPPFLFPWSLWMKVRSSISHRHELGDVSQSKRNSTKQKQKRRWEIPLTSAPFRGVEDLRSTVVLCIAAIALYFVIGALVLPFWLEPSWTLIDSLYFSMVTVCTVGYGDIVVGAGAGLRATLAKMFVISYNIYAVCISVSALGIIAKLALAQERKIMSKARERARERLIRMFDSDQDDEEEDLEAEVIEEDEDDEQCKWKEVLDEKHQCDEQQDDAHSIIGSFFRAVQRNAFNFAALAFLVGLLQRIEKWSFIDMLYYWSSTAATLGFGDVCPQTQLGRSIALLFIPLSVITLGEVIAGVFAYVTGRIAAKAEKDFLRREITLSDLEYLDVGGDGKVCELDFTTFMLVAMQKVDRNTMKDIHRLFHALDIGKDGFLQKEDLITLRQRKRYAKKLKRERRKAQTERWWETRLGKSKRSRKWFGLTF